MDWITTSTILERLRDFDQSIWGTFTQRFRTPLISFARRFGLTSADAEEVTQDILLAFAESYRAGRYNPAKGRLRSWLFAIAYNQIANFRRRRAKEQVKRDPRGGRESFWGKLPGEPAASDIWDMEWEQAQLENCLTQLRHELTENTFRVFEIVVRQGRSPDEAAAELGMSRDAVYVAKHRVLKRLGDLMKQYDEPDSHI